MTQSDIYLESDDLILSVDVQPILVDDLEESVRQAAISAQSAENSKQTAISLLSSMQECKNSFEIIYAQAVNRINNLYAEFTGNLTELKDSLVQELISTANSAKNSLSDFTQSLKNSIQNFGNQYINQTRSSVQQAQNYVLQAKDYAQQAQNAVDYHVSVDHLNQSKALETGNASNDAVILSSIKSLSRSVYDSSKFTIVGNPIVTSDGVASYFYLSGSHGIVRTASTVSFGSTFELTFEITIPSYANASSVNFLTINNVQGISLVLNNAQKIGMQLGDGAQWVTDMINGTTTLTLGASYLCKLTYNRREYAMYTSADNGTSWVKECSYASTTQFLPNGYALNIGGNRGGTGSFPGSMDLKHISLINDGNLVLSGFPAGMDTLKPNNYTVVGSPNVTNDGLASYFYYSGSRGFVRTAPLNYGSTFDLYFWFSTPGTAPASPINLFSTNSKQGISLSLTTTPCITMQLGDGTQWVTESINGTNNLALDTGHLGKLSYNGQEYALYLSSDCGVTWVKECSYASTTQFLPNGYALNLGGDRAGVGSYTGAIDLNAVKLCNDGVIDYQACLIIPYAISNTGSKIAPASVRHRVRDIYINEGYAPYYTLGETDFTLPMGEIYGMLEQLRTLINSLSAA